jgi:metallo-beta-lactamase family protein
MKPNANPRSGPPTVTFLGAAQSVSGSMHLLEAGPYRFLLDCGLHRGPREEARQRNSSFPFDPATIDAVFLSHAHVDHCGNLPNLVKQGFTGPIYCTPATRDLIAVMLEDSARIQESDADTSRVAAGHHGKPPSRALYKKSDVHDTVDQCVAVEYDTPVAVNGDVEVRFIEAGHILGSAIVAVKLAHAGREYSVSFSGDLGRRGLPYLRDPSAVPAADLIICESTYGGKVHDTLEGMATKMADVVKRTIARGGKVLIPAFSLGRTQIVLHYVRQWMAAGLLPRVPLYVDSPLAHEIAIVHEDHSDSLAPEAEEIPYEWLISADDAWYRTTHRDPCIIVASGGMCEGGRIIQHLKHHIDDPRSTVVLVSYQSPNSLGAQLLLPQPTVRIQGRTWNKWIEVAQINGFSGHADQNDFGALLRDAAATTGRVRLVHGETPQMLALQGQLREMGFADVGVPTREEVVTL